MMKIGMPVHRRSHGLPVCLLALLAAGVPQCLGGGSLETLQTKVSKCLKRPGIRSTKWGMEVIDTSNDEVLLSLNPDKPFTPASVTKVLTTSTALEKLGPDFRFRTGVYTDGVLLPDGTLAGDLYLVGRGDPHLTSAPVDPAEKSAFQQLADKLFALGIRRVQGQIIGDDSYFDTAGDGSGWTSRELKARYGAPISALSVNSNVVFVNAWPTKYKQLVAVGLEPRSSYFRIRNVAVTGSRRSRRTIGARLISGSRTIVVSGVLPAGRSYTRHLPLDQPAAVAAGVLKDELQRAGIAVDGGVSAVHSHDLTQSRQEELQLLAEYQSLPLIHALETINKDSQNLHAEMLLRTLGAELGSSGTDEAGLQVVHRFLVEAGIESRQVSLSDGSGLSRENILTPRFQTSLLRYLSTQPYFGLFLNTLAVSGTDGTLKHRMTAGPAKGVVYAKTGTLNGVSTLSGYMTTASGRQLVFSIFANNARTSMNRIRRTIDEICALLVNFY